MTHTHSPEVVNLYYCRECRTLLVKYPDLIEGRVGQFAWGFKIVPIGELLNE